MSLISKVCVMFLVWTVGGLGLYLGAAVYWYTKGFLLDPMNRGWGSEFLGECVEEMYACLGLPDPNTILRSISVPSESKGLKGNLESILCWLINGLVWPVTVSAVMTGFGNTYRRYKDEYDRGIRIRKEPS